MEAAARKQSTGDGSGGGDIAAALNGSGCNQKQFI